MQHSDDSPTRATVDWQALRQELGWDDTTHTNTGIQALLNQRARQYASSLPEDQDTIAAQAVLVFLLGTERYGIDVLHVKTVRRLERITPVPGVPPFYKGVVNIRGQIITVLDLRLFFNIAITRRDPPEELIILQTNNLEIGILAHRVQDILTLRPHEIEPLEDIRYARGMTHDRVILLDTTRLFDDERLIVGGVDE